MYVTQVSSRRKATTKTEKPLCTFQKFPVPSFIFTAHYFQVSIPKMLLLFPGVLYFLFCAERLVFSVKVYLGLICLSTLDNSIICITKISCSSCCCYPCNSFMTEVKCQHLWFAGEEQRPRERDHAPHL